MNWYISQKLAKTSVRATTHTKIPNETPAKPWNMKRVRSIDAFRLSNIVDHSNPTKESGKLRLLQHHFSQLGLEKPSTICDKWLDLAKMYKNEIRELMEPIYVHKVKNGYKIDDGNHRVWLARKLGLTTVKAVEYEYRSKTHL